MTVQIRSLNSDDFESFSRLYEQIDELHRLALPEYFKRSETSPRTKEYYERLLHDPQTLLLGAFHSGKLVGHGHAVLVQTQGNGVHVPRTYVLIDNFVVDENVRRQGIGNTLFARIREWGIEKGATEMQLNVYAFNRAARAFYERLGFTDLSAKMRRSIH